MLDIFSQVAQNIEMTEQYSIAPSPDEPYEQHEEMLREAHHQLSRRLSRTTQLLFALDRLENPSTRQRTELSQELTHLKSLDDPEKMIFATRTPEHADSLRIWLSDIVLEQLQLGTYDRTELDALSDKLELLPAHVANDLDEVLDTVAEAIERAHEQLDNSDSFLPVPISVPTQMSGAHAVGSPAYIAKKIDEAPRRADAPLQPLPDDTDERIIHRLSGAQKRVHVRQLTEAVFGAYTVHPESFSYLRQRLLEMHAKGIIDYFGSGMYRLPGGPIAQTTGEETVPPPIEEVEIQIRKPSTLEERMHQAGITYSPPHGKVSSVNHRTRYKGRRKRA